MTDTLDTAMADVRLERARQEAKWGDQNHDPFAYLTILMEEVGELAQAALHTRYGGRAGGLAHMREEAVQAAAVAVAIVECLDRGKWRWGGHAAPGEPPARRRRSASSGAWRRPRARALVSHDITLRSAALLLRKGHPPDVLVGALDDETAWGMLVALLARPALSARAARRIAEAMERHRAPDRRQHPRAPEGARPGSCMSLTTWQAEGSPCACCEGWPGCLCRCPLCRDVAEHLAGCQRCPGDPCSGYMAERLGLVAPRSGT